MSDLFLEAEAWRAAATEDAVAPTVPGFVVLASTAVHERRHFGDEWVVEQYSGPDFGLAERLQHDEGPRQAGKTTRPL